MRWAWIGLLVGGVLATLAWAPAVWMAEALATATDQRFVLADARGSLWQGSGVLVLTGGAGSRTASALPGRLNWSLGLDGAALGLRARQDCCINGELRLRLLPGWQHWQLDLLPQAGAIGQWPASWLVGLGTPWNTMQLTGSLQLSSPGLSLALAPGGWSLKGQADLEMGNLASRLTALDVLGSYRLTLNGDATQGQAARFQLLTTSGALLLSGSGAWSGPGAGRLRFQGTASAAPGAEDALGGLLNIIGRRQGTQSLITIG